MKKRSQTMLGPSNKMRGRTGSLCVLYGKKHSPERVEANRQRNATKVTWDVVRQIRAEYAVGNVTQLKLAIKFALKEKHVHKIVTFKIWKENSDV